MAIESRCEAMLTLEGLINFTFLDREGLETGIFIGLGSGFGEEGLNVGSANSI